MPCCSMIDFRSESLRQAAVQAVTVNWAQEQLEQGWCQPNSSSFPRQRCSPTRFQDVWTLRPECLALRSCSGGRREPSGSAGKQSFSEVRSREAAVARTCRLLSSLTVSPLIAGSLRSSTTKRMQPSGETACRRVGPAGPERAAGVTNWGASTAVGTSQIGRTLLNRPGE